MNPALWAAIIAAQATRRGGNESPSDQPWWTFPPTMARWPRFLLWLIRRRTQRRLAGETWVKLDDWLWKEYFAAIEITKTRRCQ